MTAERIVEYCWWYLEHLHLLLIPAAIFDVICWIAIAIFVRRRRRGGRPLGLSGAGGPLHVSTPTMPADGARP